MTATARERAEARRIASQVDPGRAWPVVVVRCHALPLETWKPRLRRETAAAVARYLTEHADTAPEVAERAGELAVADRLRLGVTRVALDAEQLAYYRQAASEATR